MVGRLGRQTAGATSLPAPVGGLNDRDSLAQMPIQDAVILSNWWVEPSKLVTRKGCVNWSTGFTSPVETIIEYSPPSGVTRLFAASGGAIYDITGAGPIGEPVVTGLNSNRWNQVSASTPGGNFLYLFNGVDEPLRFDGTDWVSVNATSTPPISGITTNLLTQGVVFKSRLFMVERESLRVWYLPAASIGGDAISIDLGSIFQRGGHLVGLYSWTIDAGNGADDHLVCISSNGEVAVYAGTDPATITSWNLIGLFYLGRPVGSRCAVKFGGDLLIICEQGIYPLGKGLLSSSIDRRATITEKIQNSINKAITAYRGYFGWELCLYPEQNALIVNVPMGNGRSQQFVQNTITQAWTVFNGWNANTFRDTDFGLFFADSDSVKLAWVGDVDVTEFITCDALQSFQYFGSPAQNKYFTMVRPYMQSAGNPSILYGINGDFDPQEVTGVLNYTPPGGMVWGEMVWGEMVWGGSLRQLSGWNTVGAIHRAAAMRIKVQNNQASTEWASTDFVFQAGGIL